MNLFFTKTTKFKKKIRKRKTVKEPATLDIWGCSFFKSPFVIIALFDWKSHKPPQSGDMCSPPPPSSVTPPQVARIGRPLPEYSHDRWQSYTRKHPKEEGGQGHCAWQLSYTPGRRPPSRGR